MRLLSLCLLLSIFNNVLSQEYEAKNTSDIIKQINIAKETIVCFSYKNNLLQDTSQLYYELFYNSQGKAVEKKRGIKARLSIQDSLFYDNDYKLVKSIMYGNPNKPMFTNLYEYDSIGNEISNYAFGYQGSTPPNDTIELSNKSKKTYNNKNQLLEVFWSFDKNENLFYKKRLYHYNVDGTINKVLYFSQNEELVGTYNYVYKKANTIIYEENKSESLHIFSESFNNKKRQCIKKIFYYNNSKHIDTYTYYSDGTLFEHNATFNGTGISLERHFYIKKRLKS